MYNHKIKNFFLTLLLVFTTVAFVFGGNIKPAQAILGVGDLSVTVGDVPRQITDLIGRIRTRFGSLAFQRAIRAVSYKLAQDTAVFIGSGGKGKKPLIFEDFGSWAKGAADEVAGKYIVNLTAGFPVDFCSPSSVKSQLAITLGISKSLSQIKIGESLLGFCPPGSAQSTQAKPGQWAKGAFIVIKGEDGEVINQITVGRDVSTTSVINGVTSQKTTAATKLFTKPVPWQGSSEKTADAIIAEINRSSADFTASGGWLDGTTLGFRVIITSKVYGSSFNGMPINFDGRWGIDGFKTEDFSGGANSVAASTGISNCVASVNRDIGRQGCSFSKIKENFAEAAKAKNFLVDFQTGFQPGKNDLLIASTLSADAKKKLEDEKQAQTIERLKTGDIKGVVDPITNQVRTPSEQTKQSQADAQAKATKDPPRTEDIFTDTLAVFTNTLAQTYLKRLQSGYYPFRSTKRAAGPDSELADSAGSTEALISSFAIFSPDRALDLGTAGEVDLFSEMTICPPAALQTPYNCLLNSGLQQAIQQSLSVAQAVNQKYIDPNLLFPEDSDPNQPKLSADNLAKLRFLRVLPVGWELAAEVLNKNGKKVEMQALLNCFDNPAVGGACDVDGSGNNDLYHLVDPDWILALPKQFCRAQGYTSIPENEKSPNRQQICVDLQSCLKQDNNGNCQAYGYCTRERAVWQLPGQSCDAQYATCRSLRRPDGTVLSVLGSDVSANGCTQGNAGCSWYSRPIDGSTDWTDANRIYLTNQAPACNPQDAGSREIIPLEPGVNLLYSASGGPVKIKPYTYYTISFAPNTAAPSGVRLAAAGAANVSFPDNTLNLDVPAGTSPSRYAGTFFSGPAQAVTITPTGTVRDLQLEEISLAAGKQALDVIRATKEAYPEVNIEPASQGLVSLWLKTFNALSSGSTNQASPATAYHAYATNRRLVFAAADTCQPEEATARLYAPQNGGGAPKVARLTAGGLCPRECAGLDTFLAMRTPLEAMAGSPVLGPVSLIPSYGRSCNAAEVGCEEFTNLAPAASEQREYYSRIEACVLDSNPNTATFYTWQGTDTAGFQLKAWQLLKDGSNGPCGSALGSIIDPGADSCPVGATSLPARACEPGANDGDCRVFLDSQGREYTRRASTLVTASPQCNGYRRTTDNRTWYFIPGEANRCSPSAAMCRQYKGRQANVTTRILFDDFAKDVDSWDVSGGQGQFYADAIVQNGHSYLVPAGGVAYKTDEELIADQANVSADYSFKDKTFVVKFLARSLTADGAEPGRLTRIFMGSGVTERVFPAGAPEGETPSRAVRLTNNWREYTVGPMVFDSADRTGLSIEAAGSSVLLDNIELTEVQDNLYLITDSWKDKQPAVCTAGAGDERFGRCQPYRDGDNNTYYVSQFAALFSPEAQFCRAVIDTQNSNAPEAQIFNNENDNGDSLDRARDNITIPADATDYFILKPENLRPQSAAGCTALGVPNENTDPLSWKDPAYRIVDPDTFLSGALCRAEGLGCQSFQSADGSDNFTLRDPGTHLCGWNSATKTFTQLDERGNLTSDSCPDPTTDPAAINWVRQCPAEQSSCTAYAPAPSESKQGEGGAATIFALSATVENGNCTAASELKDGCLAFTEGYSDGVKVMNADKLLSPSTRYLSVKSSRQCAEWLSPVTTSLGTDPKGNASRTVVYDLGRCQELGSDGRCLSWADSTNLDDALRPYPQAYVSGSANGPKSITKFQASAYKNRFSTARPNLFAGAWDYSGYSIPDQFPLEELRENTDGNVLQYGGTDATSGLACRSYPEEDAPFASANIDFKQDEKGNLKPNYGPGTRQLESLNKCAPGEDGRGTGNCECSYKKVTSTSGEAAYFSQRSTQAMPAETESITTQDGWYGYCVAYDKSTLDPNGNPICLTWWPVDAVKAKPNVFDNHPEAGFSAAAPQYYCLAAKGNKLSEIVTDVTTGKKASEQFGLESRGEKGNNYIVKIGKDGAIWETSPAATNFPLLYFPIGHKETSNADNNRVNIRPFNLVDRHGALAIGGKESYKLPFDCVQNSDGACTSVSEDQQVSYQVDSDGWSGASGLLVFPVNASSPLSNLREYDIEKIILRPSGLNAYGDWPGVNEQIFLQRQGWANNGESANDRWSAFWCNGEKCNFGQDGYSWGDFEPFITNTFTDEVAGATAGTTASKGSCDDATGTNLLATRAVFADENGKIPDDFFKRIKIIQSTLVAGEGEGNQFKVWESYLGKGQVQPHQFLGIEGGLCDGSSNEGLVDFNIFVQLREWCTTVAAVTDTATGENRAWTGRIGNNSAYSLSNLYTPNTFNFNINQDSKPFGAIVPPTNTIYSPDKWDSRLDFTEEEVLVNGKLTTIEKPLEPGKQPLYVETAQKQARAGSPYACTEAKNRCVIPPIAGAPQTEKYVASNASLADLIAYPFNYLKQIFAKVYNIWQWEGDGYKIKAGATLEDPKLKSECPIMQAVEIVGNEYRATEEKNTTADCGNGKYSVNGRPGSSLEANPVQVNAGVEVSLDFYAYNENGEQLPLRKIIIDWDEDKPETIIAGNFKNHKPVCNNDSQNYGDTNKACDQNIFQFKHIYQLPGEKTPVLTVVDNWGKITQSAYPFALINVDEPRLNLPAVALQHSPAGNPASGTGINFSWTPPAKFTIANYRLILTKNFVGAAGTQVTTRQAGSSFQVDYEPKLKSVSLSVRPCLAQGCGVDARQTVYYQPGTMGVVTLSPASPEFGATVKAEWPRLPLADFYEIEITKDGGAPVKIDTANNNYDILYEPNSLLRAVVRVQACNGVCGSYSRPLTIAYHAPLPPCTPASWQCGGWAPAQCPAIGLQRRSCTLTTCAGTPPPRPAESQTCTPPPVPVPGGWSNWSTCDKTCGTGTQTHYCNNPLPANDGLHCLKNTDPPTRGTVESRSCNTQACPANGGWGSWSTCTKTCGTGTQTRRCNAPAPGNGGLQCLFENNTTRGIQETKNCNTQPCIDQDHDGYNTLSDCDDGDANTRPGSTFKGTTRKDYNCDKTISSETRCTANSKDFAISGECGAGRRPSKAVADAWCARKFPGHAGIQASDTGSGFCNNVNEIECVWCSSSATYYW